MTVTRSPLPPAVQEVRDEMNRLRGTLFSAVEAVGFQSRKQEDALKGLVRQITYSAQSNIEAAIRRKED